jgi:hypothetical protein
LKLNIADTIGNGDLFIRNITTQENKRFNVKGGRLDTLYASTSAGGKVVSNGGTIAAEWGAGGGSNFDFHGFAGYNLNRASSYTARSFTDKNYVDSIAALSVASQWVTNGTSIYYNTGNVGVGVDTPYSKITAQSTGTGSTLTLNTTDRLGILAIASTPASLGNPQISPPIVFGGRAWNTTGNVNEDQRMRFMLRTGSGAGPGQELLLQHSKQGGAYTTAMTINTQGGITSSGDNVMGKITVGSGSIFSNIIRLTQGMQTGFGNVTLLSDNSSSINTSSGTQTYRFALFSPTVVNLTGTTVIPFENTIGTNRFGSTSGTSLFGGTTADASAKLEVQSTTQGVLFPRMTTTQKNAIASPAAGLVVYDTTLGKLCVRTASAWETITSL